MGVLSFGIEAHPFVHRVAHAKLSYATNPERFISKAEKGVRSCPEGNGGDGALPGNHWEVLRA